MEAPDSSGQISPEVSAKIHLMESKLVELNPILCRFCAEHGYTLSCHIGVWPRRKAWVREEIDRTLDLTMALTVQEFMDRGFYPQMPWSLYATASLPTLPARFLSVDVFRALSFSELPDVLASRLADGATILRSFTSEDVIARGTADLGW
jgi:hypothetical protein